MFRAEGLGSINFVAALSRRQAVVSGGDNGVQAVVCQPRPYLMGFSRGFPNTPHCSLRLPPS